MATGKKMLLITDREGKIVGAAHFGGNATGEGEVERAELGIVPLPGQEVHAVEVPTAITTLTQGHQLHAALAHARYDPVSGALVFPKVTASGKQTR